MFRPCAFCFIAFLFAACAGKKEPGAFEANYPYTQLAPDCFRIEYKRRKGESKEREEDLSMLRAAELTLEHGYKYFALVGIGDEAVEPVATPRPLTGAAGIYGVGRTSFNEPLIRVNPTSTPVRKVAALTIKCFASVPPNVIASDAANIRKAIKKKYALP